uniref:Myb-like domain-containing protein n=1 Tax=Rhizophora mucronata TaxID=61149 RepID=A0A2P2J3C1_RHIMU
MANPSGTHHQDTNNGPNPGNGTESSGKALKHNPGISTDWSPEEQAILDEGLAKYTMESSIIRYAKIAMQLQNKTVRDVALRCRWMTVSFGFCHI